MENEAPMNELEERLCSVPAKRHQNVLDVAKDANGTLKVIHTQVVVAPEKAPTPRRAHVFSSRKAFIAYAKLVASIRSVFLIDPSSGNGELVIDESVPTGGVEKVQFCPAFSLQFVQWHKLLKNQITFDQFRDLIAERKSEIIDFGIDRDGKRDSIAVSPMRRILNQITVSTAVKVHDGTGNGAINGVTTETKVKAGTQENAFDLPDSITINVPVFADEDGGPVTIDINVVPTGNGAAIKLLCGDLEEIKTAYYAKVLSDMRSIVVFTKQDTVPEAPTGFPCGYGKIGSEPHLVIRD